MKVESVFRPEVVSVDVQESLADAAERMQYNEVSSLVVYEARRFVGIITERDLVRALADRVRPHAVAVWRYMTEGPRVVGPDTDVKEAIHLMVELCVRHLPVVEGATVVGMVSARDLLAEEAGELDARAAG